MDSVKLAEDSDDLILRLHETEGHCGTAAISIGYPIGRAALTDLLERETEERRRRKEIACGYRCRLIHCAP